VSRPTKDAQFEQAEAWMLHTFGYRARDHAEAQLQSPISVAVVEIDRVFKHGDIRRRLRQWRSEDVLSNAGRKSYLDETTVLALILLQLRIGKVTLISDMARTVMTMNQRQRQAIGIKHGENDDDELLYDRIGGAVYRLMALVDEFPGPRKKIPSRDEYRALVERRDPEKAARNRARMQELFNALLEGSWGMLPKEVRARWEGNLAQDATLVALGGKAGNPAARNLDKARRSINYDAGYYRHGGNHAAITSDDAQAFKKAGKATGTTVIKQKDGIWGVEAELARIIPNLSGEADQFPLFTLAASAHIPGAIVGEGARLATSLHERGHRLNHWVVDRAYPNGRPYGFHIALRRLGAKLVFDYKTNDLDVQTHTADGFIMVTGHWFLNNLPVVLRNADKAMRDAETRYDNAMVRIKNQSLSDKDKADLKKPIVHEFAQAEHLYQQQLEQRAKYMLKPKGQMAPDGTRRYLVPINAPGYAKWKAKPNSHQGKTVTMTLPTLEELAKSPRIGGVKDEQYYQYGTPEWSRIYGLRNTVESANRNAKRSQFEGLGDPDKRAARGNTFTYIIIALALVSENLRQAVSFFKRKLALRKLTSKNTYVPSLFWQGSGQVPPPEVTPPPLR
jgi:hypothetical protein